MKQAAFSLFEMMVVLVIVGILLAIAVPSFEFLTKKSTQKIISLKLLHAIELTRQEAMTRGDRVTLCQSADQKTCGGEWQQGYVITANDQVLYASHFEEKNGKIFWRASLSKKDLQFLPSGFPAGEEHGTFWYCEQKQQNPTWAIRVNPLGKTHLVLPDENGEIVDRDGRVLQCI